MDVALATYSLLPGLDADDAPLIAALVARGLSVRPVIWDDATFDWSQARVCVVRSTWDYSERRDEFVGWAERISGVTRLFNAAEVIRWNTHKGYLRDLAARGVPVVPTEWVAKDGHLDTTALFRERGWTDAVIKPAVSANARGTFRVTAATAQAQLDASVLSGDVMIQPYLQCVEAYGERAIIVIDGEPSHAVRKSSAFERAKDPTLLEGTPVALDPAEVRIARDVLRAVPYPLLYARVDLVRDATNTPVVMELELVEPSLFFATAPHAATSLAQAIAARVHA